MPVLVIDTSWFIVDYVLFVSMYFVRNVRIKMRLER